MNGARRSKKSKAVGVHRILCGSLFLLLLLFGFALSAATARAGELGPSDQLVLAALSGVQPLPLGEMAKESARGLPGGTEAGVHIPITAPSVRLWDDVGAFSPSSIGNTVVTITTGGSLQ